MHKKWYNWR